MVRQVNLYEAKTHLSQLVEDAARGEEIIIAKNGKPLAKLTVVGEAEKPKKRVGGQWAHLRDPNDKRTPEEWWRDWKALDAEIERDFECLRDDGREYDSKWQDTSSTPTPSSTSSPARGRSAKKPSRKSKTRRTGSM